MKTSTDINQVNQLRYKLIALSFITIKRLVIKFNFNIDIYILLAKKTRAFFEFLSNLILKTETK